MRMMKLTDEHGGIAIINLDMIEAIESDFDPNISRCRIVLPSGHYWVNKSVDEIRQIVMQTQGCADPGVMIRPQ